MDAYLPKALSVVTFVTLAVELPLINLKFLSDEAPVFTKHSLIMNVFAITIVTYSLISSNSHFPVLIKNTNFLFGNLAFVIPLFILFPYLGQFTLFLLGLYLLNLIYGACPMLYTHYKNSSTVSEFYKKVLDDLRCGNDGDSSNNGSAITIKDLRHGVLGFTINVLLQLLQLKFKSMNTAAAAPFENYSVLMLIFLVAILVYSEAWLIEITYPDNNIPYLEYIGHFFGSLAIVILVWVMSH